MKTTIEKDQNAILKGYNMLLYFAGSMIMYEPVEECVADFWSKGILYTLPVSSTNPRFVKAASQLRNSCQDLKQCLPDLQADFKNLFTDKGIPLASPVKSAFFSDYSLDTDGSTKITDFYNSYGWKNRSRYNIPDDHLGIELLFLTLLTDKYSAIDDEASRREMRSEIRIFLEQHLLSWIPDWNNRMQECSSTLGYKGIANLIYAICEDIYSLLGSTEMKPEFVSRAKN